MTQKLVVKSLPYWIALVTLSLFAITAQYAAGSIGWPTAIAIQLGIVLSAYHARRLASYVLVITLALAACVHILSTFPPSWDAPIAEQGASLALLLLVVASPLSALIFGAEIAWRPAIVSEPPPVKIDTRGYIYLLKSLTDPPYYKIGKSKHYPERIRTLGVVLPFAIEPLHIIPCDDYHEAEKAWHRRCAAYRVNGEWFDLPDDVVAEFMNTAEVRREYQEAE